MTPSGNMSVLQVDIVHLWVYFSCITTNDPDSGRRCWVSRMTPPSRGLRGNKRPRAKARRAELSVKMSVMTEQMEVRGSDSVHRAIEAKTSSS